MTLAKHPRGVPAILVTHLALIGCSDPRAATEANLKAAIDAELQSQKACFHVMHGFPHEARDDRDKAAFDALTRAGLLTMKRDERADLWSRLRSVSVYDLTKQGEAHLRDGVRGSYFRSADLCYGVSRVDSIENFTTPANHGERVATSVSYWYKTEVEPWARHPALASLDRSLPDHVAGRPVHDAAMVILTDKGWMHSDAVQRMLSGPAPREVASTAAAAAPLPKVIPPAPAPSGAPPKVASSQAPTQEPAAEPTTIADSQVPTQEPATAPTDIGSSTNKRVRPRQRIARLNTASREVATQPSALSPRPEPKAVPVVRKPYVTSSGRLVIPAPPPGG